ncbi:unnamed protein product, partial [Meganyctiphanes norvegica]
LPNSDPGGWEGGGLKLVIYKKKRPKIAHLLPLPEACNNLRSAKLDFYVHLPKIQKVNTKNSLGPVLPALTDFQLFFLFFYFKQGWGRGEGGVILVQKNACVHFLF